MCSTDAPYQSPRFQVCACTGGFVQKKCIDLADLFMEDILAAVRSYTTGDRVEFSGFSSKKSTIASVPDDPERCAIAGR